jgi:hypothetical protein
MLLFAAFVFAMGVVLFLWDFFMVNPRRGYIMAEYAVPREEETTRV